MKIIRIAGEKVFIRIRVHKDGSVESTPVDDAGNPHAYTPEHDGLERVIPTKSGSVTPNVPIHSVYDFDTEPEIKEMDNSEEEKDLRTMV